MAAPRYLVWSTGRYERECVYFYDLGAYAAMNDQAPGAGGEGGALTRHLRLRGELMRASAARPLSLTLLKYAGTLKHVRVDRLWDRVWPAPGSLS